MRRSQNLLEGRCSGGFFNEWFACHLTLRQDKTKASVLGRISLRPLAKRRLLLRLLVGRARRTIQLADMHQIFRFLHS